VTDQQANQTEPSGQDLLPAAGSRPVTDLQATKSPAAAQQAPEDTAKAAPDTAEPADAPIPVTAIPPLAAAPIRATPETAAASPQPAATPVAADAGPDLQAPENPQRTVTVVPGVPRYHNASCILIRFMGEGDLETMTLAAARDAGCTPCRACLPDQPGKQPDLPPPRALVR
jgi:hypothetical protein